MDRFPSTDPGCPKPGAVTERGSGEQALITESCLLYMTCVDINADGADVLLTLRYVMVTDTFFDKN